MSMNRPNIEQVQTAMVTSLREHWRLLEARVLGAFNGAKRYPGPPTVRTVVVSDRVPAHLRFFPKTQRM